MKETDHLHRAVERLAQAGLDITFDPSHRGQRHGRFVYPEISGIASSFNPYSWNEYIDPKAGFARLAFGLPSRFEDRAADNFTRLVPLGAPNRRPETSPEEIALYAQRKIDVLDTAAHAVQTLYFSDIAGDLHPDLLSLVSSPHRSEAAPDGPPLAILTFERLLGSTDFVGAVRKMLEVLREEAGQDIELVFTCDFTPPATWRFSLLSSRPTPAAPKGPGGSPILKTRGCVIGPSRVLDIDRIVQVSANVYGLLPPNDRYEIARLIGRINRASESRRVLFIGPGRWCTTSPDLGLPTDFFEIHHAAAVLELVAMREGLTPEVSRGAHLLNELVAADLLYFALFPGQEGNRLDAAFFDPAPNELLSLVPDARGLEKAVKVINVTGDAASRRGMKLYADVVKQSVLGYRD